MFGIAAIGAGIIAFVWPDQTFVTLAVILAWYLLIDGLFEIVAAFYAAGNTSGGGCSSSWAWPRC